MCLEVNPLLSSFIHAVLLPVGVEAQTWNNCPHGLCAQIEMVRGSKIWYQMLATMINYKKIMAFEASG
jgi:hypothetical protein